MRDRQTPTTLACAAALLCLLAAPSASFGQTGFNCVPSCDVSDGRFLAMTPGTFLETLTDRTLSMQISVDSAADEFTVGFFNGTVSNDDWDVGGLLAGESILFEFFDDPENDGVGPTETPFHTLLDTDMANDAWRDFVLQNRDEALTPSGRRHRYQLTITLLTNSPRATALRLGLKVRTSAVASIEIFQQPFAFIAAVQTCKDFNAIYPGLNDPTCLRLLTDPSVDLSGSPYDGTFSFFLELPLPQRKLVIWDGDLDRGSRNGMDQDTDDVNSNLVPFADDPINGDPIDGFGSASTDPIPKNEGVASHSSSACVPATGTGCPPDDITDPNQLATPSQRFRRAFLRQPAISYEIYYLDPDDPSQRTLIAVNNDPSGNQEWEKFRIDSTMFPPPTTASVFDSPDTTVDVIHAGTYEVLVKGVDLENLNAFFFSRLCSRNPDGDPFCNPPDVGTGTPGYWKNHPEAWPVSSLEIGGIVIDQPEAIFILDQGQKQNKKSGDKTYTLAAHLIAAKLSALSGNTATCVSLTILSADDWLMQHPVGSNVRGNSKPWKEAEPWSRELDDYNNGRLCAPSRD